MKIKQLLIKVVILTLLATSLNAMDRIYLLPKQTNSAKAKIESLMNDAQSSISIAMYNFQLKNFAKKLIEAKKRGVDVEVFLDGAKTQSKKSVYKTLKKSGVNVAIVDEEKMHLKLAIFDKKIAVFGSSNWTKESFDGNYELIYTTNDKSIIKKLDKFLNRISEEN